MKRVRLLSEVHPLTDPALDALDALQQAREWFGYDIESAGGENYAEKNALIADAATAEDSLLVVRDWSHLDFIGFPQLRDPVCRFSAVEALASAFTLLRAATVRHPLPQFTSHRALMLVGDDTGARRVTIDKWFTPEFFAEAYGLFARQIEGLATVKYEDFLADSDGALDRLCDALEIPFDPTYRVRWRDFDKLTGDVGGAITAIAPTPTRELLAELRDRLLSSDSYCEICLRLGYDENGPEGVTA